MSCIEKTYFTEDDLKWLDVYKVNDTLIFQESKSLLLDTTIIARKEVFHSEFQPMSSSKILHVGKIWYLNNNAFARNESKKQEAELISMYKFYNEEQAEPHINYLRYSYLHSVFKEKLYENITLVLTDKTFKNVSVFKHNRMQWWDSQESEIQTLYWDLTNGIIRYDTFDGKIWERINW